MAVLPKQTLVQKIDAIQIESYPRPHLGASIVGEKCRRKTVYAFYWAHKNKIDARLNRIFRMGDDIEERLVEALSTIGISVTQSQLTVSDETGHAGGSIDGIANGVPGFDEPLLFEGKSMNHTNFLEVKRKGVQAAKPVHYVQMNMYMARLELKFALYVVMNKNDSSIYTEIVPFDEDCFSEHADLEQFVFTANHINEFPRISLNPSWYSCKTCSAKGQCHKGEMVERNCRTCEHSRMRMNDGGWMCSFHTIELDVADQQAGCGNFQLADMWT